MSDEAEISRLRVRAAGVLRSSACSKIRFKIDDISIQTYMYAYVAGLITDDHVHIEIGSGNGYNHVPNTITFYSSGVEDKAIVHESTHAVIDATNAGKEVSKGTHEAAAYVAESVYAYLVGDTPNTDVRYLTPSVATLAAKIVAFNKANASGLYACPMSETENIKKILGSSQLAGDQNRVDKMDGVPTQSGGLIYRMMQDSKAAAPWR